MKNPPSLTRVIFAASAGNALEWYDFIVFGYFATQIAACFFPTQGSARGLLLTFGTYGVSFLARPVGAVMLGSYADRRGRRAALTASILLMTLGTLLMAAMPGFRTIGWLAPCGILAARLIQGFSCGGEFGGATAFMIEHAGRRAGFFGSFQFISQSVSQIMGASVAWGLSAVMPAAMLNAWGFRLPFLLGLLIGPIGLYMRRHVDETPAFRDSPPSIAPLRDMLRHHPLAVLLGACTIAGGTAGTYLTIYLPTYAHRHLHMAQSSGFAVTFLATLAPLIVTPIAAHISDRVPRLPMMMVMVLLLSLVAIPGFLAVAYYPTPMLLGAVMVIIGVLRSGYTAPAPALLAELFPPAVRAVGMSLSYTIGVVVFGGFAQLTLEGLIDLTGSDMVPGAYMAVAALISFAALWAIHRRVTLHRIGAPLRPERHPPSVRA